IVTCPVVSSSITALSSQSTTISWIRNSGRIKPSSEYPKSEGFRSITAQVHTHFQKSFCACPLSRHFEVSPPSCTKKVESISVRERFPRNSEWLPNSMMSLGLGVAVHANLYGIGL